MNKSNLQVFLETSEKIASEKKQRLDEVGVSINKDGETGDLEVDVKALGWPSALLGISVVAFDAMSTVAAVEAGTAAGLMFVASSALTPVLLTIGGLVGAAFLYKYLAKKYKNLKYHMTKNKKYDPEAQAEKFVSSMKEKLLNNPKVVVTEEQLDGFLQLLSTSIKQDKKYQRLSKELLETLDSKENNELEVVDITEQLDEALQDILAGLQAQTRENMIELPAAEQEPEEELAMVAESKQYDRWKVIAGVKK
jgi:hypothetical protein